MSTPAYQPDLALLLEQSRWMEPLARRLVQDPDRAADVVQDTFAAAVQHAPAGADHPGVLRAWLARTLRNRARGEARLSRNRTAREAEVARSERLPSASEALERTEIRRKLIDVVLELKPAYRDVVLLRFFEGLEVPEVAERLDITPGTVRTRLSRALGMLRERLDGEYGGDRRAWALLLVNTAGVEWAPGAKATAEVASFAWLKLLVAVALLAAISLVVWQVVSVSPVVPGELSAPVPVAEASPVEDEAIAGKVAERQSAVDEAARFQLEERAVMHAERRIELRAGDPDGETFPSGKMSVPLGPPHTFRLAAAGVTQDRLGFPAVALLLAASESEAFEDWTASIQHRSLAVMLDGEAISVATVESPLSRGRFVVKGNFTHRRIVEILTRLGFPPRFEPFDFHLRLEHGGGSEPISDYVVETEPAGFEVRDAGGGFISVLAEEPGLDSLRVKASGCAEVRVAVSRAHPTRSEAMRLVLPHLARLEVRVIDPQGKPVAGARVIVEGAVRAGGVVRNAFRSMVNSLQGDDHLDTDKQGRGGFTALPPGMSLNVSVFPSWTGQWKQLLARKRLTLEAGETRELILTAAPLRELHVRVYGETGESLTDPAVLLTSADAKIDPQMSPLACRATEEVGLFVFEGVPAGEWWIGVAEPSEQTAPWQLVTVLADQPITEHLLQLAPAKAIRGRVVDGAGRPLAGIQVESVSEGDWEYAFEQTGADGRFNLSPLRPGVRHVWTGSRRVIGTGTWRDPASWRGPAGGPEITLVHETCSLLCRFDGESGPVPSEVDAQLFALGGGYTVLGAGWTDTIEFGASDSMYSMTPGSYSLVIRTREGLVGVLPAIEVAAGEELEVSAPDLVPGVALELRVRNGRWDNAYVIRQGGAVVGADWLPPEETFGVLVPPGRTVVELRGEGGQLLDSQSLNASAGRDVRALLEGRE